MAGLEGAIILRALSGLPFSRADTTDSLVGLPTAPGCRGTRLWTCWSAPVHLGRTLGGIYLDVRNLLNHRNVVAVRRDSGEPQPEDAEVLRLAENAYAAHPETIRSSPHATAAPRT